MYNLQIYASVSSSSMMHDASNNSGYTIIVTATNTPTAVPLIIGIIAFSCFSVSGCNEIVG